MPFRPGNVYLLRKYGDTRKGRVETLAWAYVWDMYAVERKLQDVFYSARFKSLGKAKRRWHCAPCKIGRTSRPVISRVREVNDDWSSGHTEWFCLNLAQRIVLRLWLGWYTVAPLALVTGVIILAYYLYTTFVNIN